MGSLPEARLGKADSMSANHLSRSPEGQWRLKAQSYLSVAWTVRTTRIDRTCSAGQLQLCRTPFQNLLESRFCWPRKVRPLNPTTNSANRQKRLLAPDFYSPSCKSLPCRLPVPPN